MISIFRVIGVAMILGAVSSVHAFQDNSFGMGLGFFAQNAPYKTAAFPSGQAGLTGELSLPLHARYEWNILSDWFLAPQLFTNMLVPRKTPGDTAKVTITHLVFQFGRNLQNGVDWSIGPGIMMTKISGAGGVVTMSNGTGYSPFAQPAREVALTKTTMNLGASLGHLQNRFGFDFIIENLLSSTKRTYSYALTYTYIFSGGYR